MQSTTCKNCDTRFAGNYCPECGQKANTQRITLRHSAGELLDVLFNLHRGLLPTVRDLVVRPGSMLRDYLAGKRRSYINPGRFLLAVVAFSYLIHFVLFPELFTRIFMQGGQLSTDTTNDPHMFALAQYVGQIMGKNYTFISGSTIPFAGFFSWLFFYKARYNLAEHLAAMTYLQSIVALIPLVLVPLLVLEVLPGMVYTYASLLMLLVYVPLVLVKWLQPARRWWGWVRALLGMAVSYLIWLFLFFVFITITGLRSGALDPAMLGVALPTNTTQYHAPLPADTLVPADSIPVLLDTIGE